MNVEVDLLGSRQNIESGGWSLWMERLRLWLRILFVLTRGLGMQLYLG